MYKRSLIVLCLLTSFFVSSQDCPRLTFPADGSIGVPVDATITWPVVPGIIGYLISLGTTPGGSEILNQRSAGLTNSYTPEVGLPENTQIFVTISLFIADQPLKVCPVESFWTEDVTIPPLCTTLDRPGNGETFVNANTDISWNYAPKATGYRISIGTSQDSFDILENLDVGNVLLYNPTGDLPIDTDIYVKIIPYNENGEPTSCPLEMFTTGVQDTSCEAFFDPDVGELVFPRPMLKFPDRVSICVNESSTLIQTPDEADGFRWYRINPNGTETLISDRHEVSLSTVGRYRYEAYNLISQIAGEVECSETKQFIVVASERPVISDILVDRIDGRKQITVETTGQGNYEYALNDPAGPYQLSPVFGNLPDGENKVYVRDINGCGRAERKVPKELSADDFPRFFTPNGDGVNDYWQFVPSPENVQTRPEYIHVFDRYGVFLAQIMPNSKGWDGTFNGQPLPSNNYWFIASVSDNQKIKGYFVLKR